MLGYAGARAAARVGTVVARYAFGEHIESGTLVDRTEIVGEKDPDRRVHPDYRDVRPSKAAQSHSAAWTDGRAAGGNSTRR
ncbi:hypothetical protein BRC60_06845 [Halobacteriales archaeon QH_1_68_42]|nr:MAG: hypothetical protein BRC60_06845 [Halobacteriales archaeon QH_1_68_42]